ncbi:siderophore iron transporter mirC [Microsporum canis CBS 113480]|uniref:Siderophore iron transporter mirC n=1 Tax=Arthroderma otae (strain ATCC MYA-4605 / CBS 113480) TaxID=554155 RepID=C5FLX3_ARTOC|nr:siderophore iron transporter mirC [Microsporum canis CBS 113480]EEQ30695.1 siderophore iron transporter mirC [Microsporum canis CBS 113480]
MGQIHTRTVPSYGSCEPDDRLDDIAEADRLLQATDEADGTDEHLHISPYPSSSDSEVQEGVRKIEAISRTWTQKSLLIAYLGKHSLISTVLVIQNVVNAVIKPPMAKFADVFGRFEAFCIAVFIYVLGYIQMAASQNVETYASAQIFYSAGSTGLQILQQVFIADSSNLLNRALFAILPEIPFLITVWVGPMIASWVLKHLSWRWGYGMWVVLLPLAFLPLALSLCLNQRKAQKLNLLKPKPWKGKGLKSVLRSAWFELDIFGLILLSAAVTLILVPLTLAAHAKDTWRNGAIVAMIVVGAVCLVAYPFWETSKRLAPHPLLSLGLLRQRTALAGCALAFFYFMAFYFSVQPYFYSYLQVVQGKPVVTAGRITQTFSFMSTIAALVVSFMIKYSKRYRPFITFGCVVYILGLVLMLATHKSGKSTLQILVVQSLIGVGGGLVNVPVQLGVQASANHQQVAAATAMFLTALEMGGAVGSAVSGAIWTTYLPSKLVKYLPDETKGEATEIFGKLTKALSYPMGSPTRDAIIRSYEETMQTLLTIAICVCIPLIPLSLLMKNYELDKVDQRVKGKMIGNISEDGEDVSPVTPQFSTFPPTNASPAKRGSQRNLRS